MCGEISTEGTSRPRMLVGFSEKADKKITEGEVEKTLKKLNAGKAPGWNGVVIDYMKI